MNAFPTDLRGLSEDWARACRTLPEHLQERVRAIASAGANDGLKPRILKGPVVYWTHHALRVDENPALDVARTLAVYHKRPLLIYRGLSASYRYASDRHHAFQLQSTRELAQQYRELGLRFAVYLETRDASHPMLLELAKHCSLLVTEDFPGEPTERWLWRLARTTSADILAVDTACVVPMRLAGRAYDRAFSFRDATKKFYDERINRPWPECTAKPEPFAAALPFPETDLSLKSDDAWMAECDIDHSIPPVADTLGGSTAGYSRWNRFVANDLRRYASKRNDPCADVSSRMSAYLHYGMVSPMRLAREANQHGADKYLDELLIWRELAYGYCFHRKDYDQITSIPAWAQETLSAHAHDPRETRYSWETLARAKTHDRLWNACQRSLLLHGELHNNVRMTWGKAFPHWSLDADEALRNVIDLNHRYALDGRDPASFGGILWCFGQFDRPFHPEQPILGNVRPRSTHEHAQRLDLDRYEALVSRPISNRRVRVAIIGAGMAGLMCARTLLDHGIEVDIVDKSRAPGGRTATRRWDNQGRFDHGPSYTLLRNHRWSPLIESWRQDNIIAPWDGRVVQWLDGQVREAPREGIRWVGVGGMHGLGKHIARDLSVRFGTFARGILVQDDGTYRITISETASLPASAAVVHPVSEEPHLLPSIGPYDIVLWSCPPAQTASMLPADCLWKPILEGIRMLPCWATMVRFAERLNVDWDGAHIADEVLSWMARESSKPGRSPRVQGGNFDDWVVHANHNWSLEHLESSPDALQPKIVESMERIVGIPLPPIESISMHRWRYAWPAHARASGGVSNNTTNPNGYLWDAERRIGVAGDWVGREAGIEGAMKSGVSLAGAVMRWLVEHGAVDGSAATAEMRQLELF